jgi:uncharacterized protein YjgD (DUF1641 family)
MTETTSTEIDVEALESAVADHPEVVARLLAQLDATDELLAVLEDGANVSSVVADDAPPADAGDGTAGREAVDAVLAEEGDDLAAALATLADLQRTGTLDELVGLTDAVTLGTAALDDEMVVSLARTGAALGEVADVAGDPDTARGVRTLLGALGDATDAAEIRPVGPLGLVRSLWNADVRVGLGYLVAVARHLGRRLRA